MEALLGRLFAFLGRQRLVFYAGIGFGVYRCLHEWPLWFNGAVAHLGTEPLSDDFFFLTVDAGKVLGLIAYVGACYRWDPQRRVGFLFALPSIVTALGCTVPLAFLLGAPLPPAMLAAALALIGAGAAMLFAQWIELCGLLPPIKVIQIFCISFLTRFAALPLLTDLSAVSSAVTTLLLASASFIWIGFCLREIPTASSVPRTPSSFARTPSRAVLFLFIGIFAFAYGLGASATLLSHAPHETGWGTALPSCAILILSFKLEDRFDWTILYATTLPLMAAGLMGIEFLGLSPSLAQVLVSAAYSSFDLIVYTLVCSNAYRNRISAMLEGSSVRALALIAADGAILIAQLVFPAQSGLLVTGAVLTSFALGIMVFLPQMGQRGEGYLVASERKSSLGSQLERLAAERGLSQRETTIFLLLVEGKTSAEISEELFISNGAVRAHNSRIYDKFGVHTRKDFDALFS